MGKNNIRVIEDNEKIEAIFETKTSKLTIRVEDKIIKKIISRNLKKNTAEMIQFSENLREYKINELFTIKKEWINQKQKEI